MDLFGDAPVPQRAKSGFTHEPTTGEAESVEWYTPAWIFEAIGLTFDLDPCSPPGGLPWIPARHHYALPQDGLALPWEGAVWCNPPYGLDVKRWLGRMSIHNDGIALVFARTDTAWFHAYCAKASAILFIEKRLAFVPANPKRSNNGAGAGSMLVAWGERCGAALERMSAHGMVVKPERPAA